MVVNSQFNDVGNTTNLIDSNPDCAHRRDVMKPTNYAKRRRRKSNRRSDYYAAGCSTYSIRLESIRVGIRHSQMSHQTGAMFMALSRHMIELTPKFIHARAVQVMYRQVPAFHACQCHDRGIRTRNDAKNAKMGYAGYEGSDMTSENEREMRSSRNH